MKIKLAREQTVEELLEKACELENNGRFNMAVRYFRLALDRSEKNLSQNKEETK